MDNKLLVYLCIIIAVFSALASGVGIFTSPKGAFNAFEDTYLYNTIRGETVEIYNKGLYKDMTAEVAVQGIAQDYLTFFVAVPFLLIILIKRLKNSLRYKLLLSGTIAYFLVTYLFYTAMGMYNYLFLIYVFLLGLSFIAFIISIVDSYQSKLSENYISSCNVLFPGYFLMFNAVIISFLWLSVILQPLFSGEIYPKSLEHYTTLIVQAFDLALLLPLAFISGYQLIRKKRWAYISSSIYLIFLCFMMTALILKIVFMAINGVNVIPVIFIIPVINIFSLISAFKMIKNI